MFQRITYFLEKQYYSSRIKGNPFTPTEDIDIFHVSTPEHLQNFLEKVFYLFPNIKIRLTSYLGVDGLYHKSPLIEKIKEIHDLNVLPIVEIIPPRSLSNVSVMLYSDKINLKDEPYRKTKKAFTKSRSSKKLIIQGDGLIFQGSFLSRLKRKCIRFLLKFLIPLRDKEENRILSNRILHDPKYDAPPPP
jgi:hypothetical protein